ncbi:MAG: hypothetical protein K1Y36_29140 [Blastocatellia bacterium]|nr:hypothetical protein [Blastocatellia bacterium]
MAHKLLKITDEQTNPTKHPDGAPPRWLHLTAQVDWESTLIRLPAWSTPETQRGVYPLDAIQGGLGTVQGTIIALHGDRTGGTILIDNHEVEFKAYLPDRWKNKWKDLLHQEHWFQFGPRWSFCPSTLTDGIRSLRPITLIRPTALGSQCLVEVMGRVRRVFSDGMVVAYWSKSWKRYFYAVLTGPCGSIKHRNYVRVLARYQPVDGLLVIETTQLIQVTNPYENNERDPDLPLAASVKKRIKPAAGEEKPITLIKAGIAPGRPLMPNPGRIDISIRISAIPSHEITREGVRFLVYNHGITADITLKPQMFEKIEEAAVTLREGWVALISGKLTQLTENGIVLNDAHVQIIEKTHPK